ncbi:MAG TPA: MFS transporter, partial [Gemmatimonadetes bacterium]|nr:MFS transporter [Gemmatimonadota bacterium]
VVANTQGANARLSEETFRTLVLWSLLPAFLAVVVLAMGARDVAIPGLGGPSGPRVRIRGLGKGFAAFAACSVVFELGNS